VPMPSLLNQTGTIKSISECDFLVATKSQSYTDGKTVEFKETASFKHVSTLLQLTFNGGGDLEGSVLTKITVTGNGLVASSTYAFGEEGGVSLKLKEDSSDDVLVASLSNKDGEATMGRNAKSFYLIVNARTKEELSTVSLTVEYKKGETPYVASLENLTSNGFVGGTCQSYTFTIKDASISIVGSSIEEWSGGESLGNIEINGEETTASV
ncbi:MAG: fimbrillin family protein, partial [Bacteroides sp.]|nr:fimbrillin family protein [Bacteroides sp.]